jgi:hypothetical protein
MQSTRWFRVSSDTVAWSRGEDPNVVGGELRSSSSLRRIRGDDEQVSLAGPVEFLQLAEHGFRTSLL